MHRKEQSLQNRKNDYESSNTKIHHSISMQIRKKQEKLNWNHNEI